MSKEKRPSPAKFFVFGLFMVVLAWVGYHSLYPQVSNPSELMLQSFYMVPPFLWPTFLYVAALAVSCMGLLFMLPPLLEWFPFLRPPFRWLFGVKSKSIKKPDKDDINR